MSKIRIPSKYRKFLEKRFDYYGASRDEMRGVAYIDQACPLCIEYASRACKGCPMKMGDVYCVDIMKDIVGEELYAKISVTMDDIVWSLKDDGDAMVFFELLADAVEWIDE